MKNVVVFTEGKSELIFIRHLLTQIIGYQDLSFDCLELHSDSERPASWQFRNPNALVYYLIINVGTDEKVLSEIEARSQKYIARGFEIIGIRDMYCELYQKRLRQIHQAENVINDDVNSFFIQKSQERIQGLENADKIHFFFAIMEIEAWFLAIYWNLERIHHSLSAENIRNQLGFELEVIDPETTFFRPAAKLKQILLLANRNYDKHEHEVESIVSSITLDDITQAINSNRCRSLRAFVYEIQREFEESLE